MKQASERKFDRNEVLKKCFDCLVSNGLENTSIRSFSTASGLNSSSLYYYFMYEYPPCSSEADSAYYAIFLAFLNRLSCDTEFVDEDPDYILPQSAQRRLTEDDLSGLTHEELCLARNEIYARHGRRFKNQNIASYFESKDWYVGSIDPETFDANQSSYFSQDELYNATFLLNYEKQKFGKSFY